MHKIISCAIFCSVYVPLNNSYDNFLDSYQIFVFVTFPPTGGNNIVLPDIAQPCDSSTSQPCFLLSKSRCCNYVTSLTKYQQEETYTRKVGYSTRRDLLY